MKALSPARFAATVTPFALFFLGALAICPLVGAVPLDLSRALDFSADRAANADYQLLFVLRLPRALLAALTGSALAMAGAAFQALLRNPLAEPYTLGVSSGGALGAVLAIKLGLDITFAGLSSVPLFSFAGSLSAMGVIYLLARGRGRFPTSVLLLSGVTISFFFASMILFIHYIADFTENQQMIRWMMGGLDIVGFSAVMQVLPLWIVGALAVLYLARDLNVLSFGDVYASSKGIDVPRTQKGTFIFASMMTGAVVSAAGPIGFVGLIVPHALRFFTGPDLRVLAPASALAGAGFLILCDTAARTILGSVEIPVGVLTAMLGGPFFLFLLMRHKRRLGATD
ncbi:MAG: iron ABC transporter permease [Deltaproteobacteria bacterium]|nr:iron ABC transporter permease [Deltaproteobacteria bacterium]